MPDPIAIALRKLQRNGLPVTPGTERALRNSLANYGVQTSERIAQRTLDNLLEGIHSILNPADVSRDGQSVIEGATRPSLTGDIMRLLGDYGTKESVAQSLNLDFKIKTAVKVSRGAGHFLTDQTDVDEYPAWELHRLYDRDVPRGFKATKGGLVEVPDDDWPSRFRDAAEQAGDADALRVLEETGRMIALKSSGTWPALGGIRPDGLGNPFAPFAFNSGYGTDGVPYKECVELGFLDAGDKPERTEYDFASLFKLPEAA